MCVCVWQPAVNITVNKNFQQTNKKGSTVLLHEWIPSMHCSVSISESMIIANKELIINTFHLLCDLLICDDDSSETGDSLRDFSITFGHQLTRRATLQMNQLTAHNYTNIPEGINSVFTFHREKMDQNRNMVVLSPSSGAVPRQLLQACSSSGPG